MSQVEGTEFANPYCKHHLLKIAEGNRCKHWSVYLHNRSLGCSVQSRERDNTIECLPTVGCREWSRTASAVQPESVQSSDNDDSFLNIDEDHDDQSSIQRGLQKSIILQRVIALMIWLSSQQMLSQKCGLVFSVRRLVSLKSNLSTSKFILRTAYNICFSIMLCSFVYKVFTLPTHGYQYVPSLTRVVLTVRSLRTSTDGLSVARRPI